MSILSLVTSSAIAPIGMIGFIIFFHELGHFLLARFNGIEVLEFAVGFGPKLISRKWGTTTYALRAIPLGGFVRMSGDDPRAVSGLEEALAKGEEIDEESRHVLASRDGWFLSKGYLAKVSVILAGPFFNLLLALLLSIACLHYIGIRVANEVPVLGEIITGYPAEKAGLLPGDEVRTIDGLAMATWADVAKTVNHSGGKPLTLVIARPKGTVPHQPLKAEAYDELTIAVTGQEASAEFLAARGLTGPVYQIGIGPSHHRQPLSLVESIESSGYFVFDTSYQSIRGFWSLLIGRISHKNLGGPIMMLQEGAKSAKGGAAEMLEFMILVNVSLAVLNLLPIPVLDGGHIMIFTIEAVRGAALSMRVYERVTIAGMLFIFSLMLLALSNDILRVVGWQ